MAEAAVAQAPELNPRFKQLVDDLWNDKELGPKVRARAKAKWSDISIPEETIAPAIAPLQDEVDGLKKQNKELLERMDKREKDEGERTAQANLETALENARKKFHLTDEGFQMMVDRMKEKQNYTDAESAAAWVAAQNVPPAPAGGPSWAPQSLDLYGSKNKNDDFALLHKDPEAFFDKTVADILSEARAA